MHFGEKYTALTSSLIFFTSPAKEQKQEEGMMKGIVNPAFLCGEEEDEQSCGRQRDRKREIGGDGQDSTLATHQQQMKLEALASTRGEASLFITLKNSDRDSPCLPS